METVKLKSAARNIVLVAVFIFTVIGFFQNCTQAVTNGGTNTQQSGNGEGYGGKARYENPNGTCPGGTTNPPGGVNAIERNGRIFSLVRKDCADVTPAQDVTAMVEYLPHSKETAVYQGHIYQVPGSLPPVGALTQDVHRFCRVSMFDGAGTGEVIDAYILRVSDGTFRARVSIQPYSAYLPAYTPLLDASIDAVYNGADSYSGDNLPGIQFMQLDITLPGATPLNFNLAHPATGNVSYRSALTTCYSY